MNRISDEQRFWSKVDKSILKDGCWLFTGSLCKGYGQAWMNNKRISAHRMAWILEVGHIPKSICVLHKCDVRNCVNPEHLWLGAIAENNADRDAKGRLVSVCGDSHHARLHPENLSRGDSHYARRTPWVLARGKSHGSKTKPERLARGENHGNAVLNDAKVRNIRHAVKSMGMSSRTVGRLFGINKSTVLLIASGKLWSHVK